jgi:hypothetical protein
MTTHKKLADFKKWVDVDVNSPTTNTNITNIINNDLLKDSPTILRELDGKYSPYKAKLSYLAKTHLELIKTEQQLINTITVLRAFNKFKKNIKSKNL